MIADEVDIESRALHQLSVSKLHERFVHVYGEEPRSRNRVWRMRKILWRLQSLAPLSAGSIIEDWPSLPMGVQSRLQLLARLMGQF